MEFILYVIKELSCNLNTPINSNSSFCCAKNEAAFENNKSVKKKLAFNIF